MVGCVLNKIRGLKFWNIFHTNQLEYGRDIRYFRCKGKICRYLRDDQSGEDVISWHIDIKELKYKYRMGVVFPVVYTVTYVYQNGTDRAVLPSCSTPFQANAQIHRLGTTNASLKLKEIDGYLSQLWIIWFNPI